MILLRDSTIPLYKQVYNYIVDQIESGAYKNGDKLPSQNKLAELCGVSVVTARKALEQLAQDEIIMTRHGTGSFVTSSKLPNQIFAVGSFTEACRRNNSIPKTTILSRHMVSGTRRALTSLNLETGTKLLQIERLRFVDDQACILERDYFQNDDSFLKKENLENQSILSILSAHHKISEFYFDDFFDIVYASADDATHLDCTAGTPLLRVSEIVRGEVNGIIGVLYYNEQLIRTDRYHYAVGSKRK